MAALLSPVHRRGEGIKWWLVFYTVVMFSFVTVYTSINLHIQSISFIDNRELVVPGPLASGPSAFRPLASGPLAYEVIIRGTTLGLIPNVMFNSNNWLADGLLVGPLFDAVPTTCVSNACSDPRSTVVTLSTPKNSGLLPFLASCTWPLLVRTLPLHKPTGILWTNPTNIGMGIIMLYFQTRGLIGNIPVIPYFGALYLSISVSLNVLLTLMIVIRLVLHGRSVRAATGSPAGISGLCKAISTMLIESCALFTVSSLLVVVPLATIQIYNRGDEAANIFYPILAETQVRALPRLQSPGQLPDVTVDRAGDCSTSHYSKGRQPERLNEPRDYHWTRQFGQIQEARRDDG